MYRSNRARRAVTRLFTALSISLILFLSFLLVTLVLLLPSSALLEAAANNSRRYRTKIGVQNYATRGSGISSSADLARPFPSS